MGDQAEMSYADHFRFCARFDTWRLKTACRLYTGQLPEYADADGQMTVESAAIYEAALSCAGLSLPLVDVTASTENYRVRPTAFTNWAAKFGVRPCSAYAEAGLQPVSEDQWERAESPDELRRLFLDATGHHMPANVAAKLRAFNDNQRSRWRSRGLGAYLWSLQPEMSTAEMARSREIKQFGCEGGAYNERQVREWLADLNPSPKAGRPRKSA